MELISEDVGRRKSDGLKAIIAGGSIAGALDIAAAAINAGLRTGRGIIYTFQSVAGGLYGAETFNGGYRTAALGLAIHFFIALTAAALYYAASRKLRFMIRLPVLSGVLYGVAVWLWMYLVVLPLSAWKLSTYSFSSVAIGILIHIFCVGLPIALIVRRFSK
ncbi:MAG TPA: hypothetical protein VIL74_05175 [Pyrinomonadaceae bacterium]|jgi:hypothetical protein